MSEFASILNVSTLDGNTGFRIDGAGFFDFSGTAVASGGDINGDGFADVLIGEPESDIGGVNRGLCWIVFGAANAPASQNLNALVSAETAYRIQGEAAGDQLGTAISNAGDVNGDGFDDFIVGARYANPDAGMSTGASYLVFGGASQLAAFDNADGSVDHRISLSAIAPATGYRFDGEEYAESSGYCVSGAGDVNGDGFADLLIGDPFFDPTSVGAPGHEGASYIVFGGASNLSALDGDDGNTDGRIDLSNISAGQGLRMVGDVTSSSGLSVALVGDVNGDGFDDAMIGAPSADINGDNDGEGAAYLVFGREQSLFTATSLALYLLAGIQGTYFVGAAKGDTVGGAVAGLGDINGDGLADFAIGAPGADVNGYNSGSAYVVFGKRAFGASADLSSLDGNNGFRIDGLRPIDFSGRHISSAGDINGDGFDDILIGVGLFDRLGANNAGAAFVLFGKEAGFDRVIDLGSLDGDKGFRIDGAVGGDYLGGSVSAASDVNGDGFDDIILSAFNASNNGLTQSGSTYVIYGHRAETAVTRVGTSLDNTINGGKGDDSISGLSGDDTLIGWEGDDEISGSDGRDTIDGGSGDDVVSGGSDRDKIDGGDGNDTISGGSERDTFIISVGEDHYDGGSEKDQFDFASYGQNAVTIDLATGQFLHFNGEDISTFVSVEDVKGTSRADTILGNFVNNSLLGRNGADTLDGRDGNDRLTGGKGQDTQTGGEGKDLFIFTSELDSGAGASQSDVITDFEVVAAANKAFIDRIDLSSIDAKAGTGGNQVFTFIGGANFTSEGQIRATQSGVDTVISINTTGTDSADMKIVLANLDANTLNKFDFVL